MAHTRQSRLDAGLGVQVKVLPFEMLHPRSEALKAVLRPCTWVARSKETPPSKDPTVGRNTLDPMVVLGGGAVSDERGTSVDHRRNQSGRSHSRLQVHTPYLAMGSNSNPHKS